MNAQFAITTAAGLKVASLRTFFEQYLHRYPDAKLQVPELYLYHPLSAEGRNVFVALAPHATGETPQVLGFAPLFAAPAGEDSPPSEPHHIWTIVLACLQAADHEAADEEAIRRALLEQVLAHAAELAASFPQGRPTRLATDMMASQTPDIDFLLAQGFVHFDSLYVFQRDPAAPIPEVPTTQTLTLRRWRMPTTAEQQSYLDAFNRCFPELPKTLESLQFLLQSPFWTTGTAVAAFDEQEALVGSVLCYVDPSQGIGITDDVFVLPEWRGRGVARWLVAEGLRWFREQNVAQVRLEVRRTNPAAQAVYRSVGFEQVNEEVLLGRML